MLHPHGFFLRLPRPWRGPFRPPRGFSLPERVCVCACCRGLAAEGLIDTAEFTACLVLLQGKPGNGAGTTLSAQWISHEETPVLAVRHQPKRWSHSFRPRGQVTTPSGQRLATMYWRQFAGSEKRPYGISVPDRWMLQNLSPESYLGIDGYIYTSVCLKHVTHEAGPNCATARQCGFR